MKNMPPSLVTLKPDTPIKDIVAVPRSDGGAIIADLVDPEVLDRFDADLKPIQTAIRPRADQTEKGQRPWCIRI
jgi:hypothetical protein